MRIGLVITTLGMGGAERQALAVGERLTERGHTVQLLVLGRAVHDEWPTKLPVTRLGMRKNPFSFLHALWQARRWLKSFRPRLLHSHCFHSNLFARCLKLLSPRIVVVNTVHNVWEGGWLRMMAYAMTDRLVRQTTAVSQAAAERYVCMGAVKSARMRVLANGIDVEEFAPSAERREAMRAAMEVSGEFIWMTAGRLAPAKDLPNLLRAFELVAAKKFEARLWIAGEGGDREALQELAASLGLEERVRWLGLRRDLPALLDAADGFVLASAWEGMPLVLGEAMAMEKPVAATGVGGVRELVGFAGCVVEAKDPRLLADAMLGLMKLSPKERQQVGRLARERVASCFSIESRVLAWEQIYWSLVEEER
jgi:glycosyltransferase involved in cell wall biosynthesis